MYIRVNYSPQKKFCAFNFHHLSNWWKSFNGKNFPIYGISLLCMYMYMFKDSSKRCCVLSSYIVGVDYYKTIVVWTAHARQLHPTPVTCKKKFQMVYLSMHGFPKFQSKFLPYITWYIIHIYTCKKCNSKLILVTINTQLNYTVNIKFKSVFLGNS